MHVKGWVKSEWRDTPTNRRARYYQLTALGRKQLGIEASSFSRVVEAIGRVMQAEEA
jgi:DNA-binding PadR family transcriptional regulator